MPFSKESAADMPNHESYDLYHDSPRSSIESNELEHTTLPNASPMSSPTITPSIRLLFSFISRRHLLILLLPAILASIIAGGVAPFMTFVVGQAFDAFAHFPITPDPPQAAKDALLRDVGIAALQLIGLAAGALALGSLTSCLWIWIGETNAMTLRKAIYVAVSQKNLTWFDMHTTNDGPSTESSVGAGGLMAKFSRYPDLFLAVENTLIFVAEKPTKLEWHHLWLPECSFNTLPPA
jgi:ATP-binding cassette subfamily B (MDR/TAP) protein 1